MHVPLVSQGKGFGKIGWSKRRKKRERAQPPDAHLALLQNDFLQAVLIDVSLKGLYNRDMNDANKIQELTEENFRNQKIAFLKRLDAFLESEGMEMTAYRSGELVFEPRGGSYGIWVEQNPEGPYKPLAECLRR